MTENTKQERIAVQHLLDTIEDAGWVVRDYDADLDPYDVTRLALDVERTERGDASAAAPDPSPPTDAIVRDFIQSTEQQYDVGVPEDVIQTEVAVAHDAISEADVREALDNLRAKGEVYEPTEGHLRAT